MLRYLLNLIVSIFVFEFRNESWFDEEIYEFLGNYSNIIICSSDSPMWQLNLEITGSFVYIRMHGGKILNMVQIILIKR